MSSQAMNARKMTTRQSRQQQGLLKGAEKKRSICRTIISQQNSPSLLLVAVAQGSVERAQQIADLDWARQVAEADLEVGGDVGVRDLAEEGEWERPLLVGAGEVGAAARGYHGRLVSLLS